MTLRLNGSTSGYTEIDAPAVAGSNTLRFPGGNGSDGNILGTDGAGNLSWVNGRMVLATAQNSTSGTSIDFTGIPSWVKKISVMLNGVSTNGSSLQIIQLGTSGGFQTSGYSSAASTNGASNTATAGILVTYRGDAANTIRGLLTLALLDPSTGVWVASGVTCGAGVGNDDSSCSGSKTLSGTLDRIRITTVNGTDTFDAGSINILYEG